MKRCTQFLQIGESERFKRHDVFTLNYVVMLFRHELCLGPLKKKDPQYHASPNMTLRQNILT